MSQNPAKMQIRGLDGTHIKCQVPHTSEEQEGMGNNLSPNGPNGRTSMFRLHVCVILPATELRTGRCTVALACLRPGFQQYVCMGPLGPFMLIQTFNSFADSHHSWVIHESFTSHSCELTKRNHTLCPNPRCCRWTSNPYGSLRIPRLCL